MIYHAQGNMFNGSSEAVVNTVNIEGIMGAGIAKYVKENFKESCQIYYDACNFRPRIFFPGHTISGRVLKSTKHPNVKHILHTATKGKVSRDSELGYIYNCMSTIVGVMIYKGIKSVAIPPLGCGYGGLNWEDVLPIIEKFSKRAPYDTIIYDPIEESEL